MIGRNGLRRAAFSALRRHRAPLHRCVVCSATSSETSALRRKSWKQVVDEIDDPKIRELRTRLDETQPLWVRYLPYFNQVKRAYPGKMVFVRSGDAYEVIGIDALMLAHYAEMSLSTSFAVPHVRCLADDLEHYLRLMTRRFGFAAAICEVVDQTNKLGHRRNARKHYVARIVGGPGDTTSLDPNEALRRREERFEREFPLAAVSWSQTGFCLFQYFPKQNAIKVTARMSEEGLWAKLNSTGMTTPLYLHASSMQGAKIDVTAKEWQSRAQEIAASVFGSVERYEATDPQQGFLQMLGERYPDKEVDAAEVLKEDAKEKTSPLPLSTVNEIVSPRLHGGGFAVVDYIVPSSCPKLLTSWLQRCILDPPSPRTAQAIQKLCAQLGTTACSVPQLNANISPNRIAEALNARKWSVEFLDELRKMIKSLLAFLEDPQASHMVEALLQITGSEVQRPLEPRAFCQECRGVVDEISEVVLEDLTAYYARSAKGSAAKDYKFSWSPAQDHERAAQSFLEDLEPLSAACTEGHWLKAEADQVQTAGGRFVNELSEFLKILPYRKQVMYKAKGELLYFECVDPKSLPRIFAFAEANEPQNRIGLGKYRAVELTTRLEEYKSTPSTAEAELRFQQRVEALMEVLTERLPCILSAAKASIILSALAQHVTKAQSRDWCLPDIARLTEPLSRGLKIEGFWPYWLEKDNSTLNFLVLDQMAILTGPNTAGKSTVLRSVAAVCALGLCGFYVPAVSASLPFLDCVNLKTLNTDSPLEGQSAFAMEMTEMRHVLHDATPQSLVLIDELGKGTEVLGGTAISTSIFKELYDRGATGLFATHLHRIARFGDDFPRASYYRMLVERATSGVGPDAWRLVEGFCERSFGLDVALREGIPAEIVDRAQELIDRVAEMT